METTSTPAVEPAGVARWLLAALSFGAGAIHLAMVPVHAPGSLAMGLAFAAAGWFQIAFGAAVIARPSRPLAQAAIAANLAFLAVWALSRTVGLPAWTGSGGAEPAAAVDLVCVVLEAGIVIGAVALLVAPGRLGSWSRPVTVVAGIAAAGALIATTAVLAAPGTADHGHGEVATGDHGHGTAAASGAAPGEHSMEPGATMPAGGHTHGESDITYDRLPAATKAEVDQVIAGWSTTYPTAAEATAAGWKKLTPNLYGIGSHYAKDIRGLSVAQPFDMLHPNILLYDGEGPDARFAGVSYIVADDIEGFTGSYDTWHAHASVCIKDGKISLTEESSKFWYSESECTAAGGRMMKIGADKMMHLWIGPGYTDAPIFAHDNPEIFDGYYPKQTG